MGAVALYFKADVGGAMPGAAVCLSGVALIGYHDTYSEVPWPAFALPAVAPLALLAVLCPPLWRLTGRRLRLVQLAMILAPLAAAVWLAARAETLDFDNM
jgi:hypothetical protein